ncbi:MAG: hypothetical protein ACTHKX_00400 [Pseudolysinimonas sp.]
MTLHDEPRTVDLDEILVDEEEQGTAASGAQWALVIVGGVIGVAGLLTVLAVTAPAIIDLVSWISSIQKAITGA